MLPPILAPLVVLQAWTYAGYEADPQMCPMPHQGAAKPAESPILGKCGLTLCNCCEAVKGMDAARKDDFDLIRHQAEKIKAAEKKAKAEPKAEPPPPGRVWVTNAGRYGWGRIEGGYFVPAPGDDPTLYDSGPEPRYQPPAPAPAARPVRYYYAGSACSNGRCPR